jgi:uncharacterized membrane protein YfcA
LPHIEIAFFFFFIAVCYASVGFGGGSSYLAVLALYNLPFKEMRLIALLCNIVVVTGGTIIFIRHRQVDFRKIIPVVLLSVPLAFAGAAFKISQQFFFMVLGISLIAAAILLWIDAGIASRNIDTSDNKRSWMKNSLLGGLIGFLSGMVGIGGGIFLSPVLNLMRWDTPKRIAATASIFILVNSISGIAGQLLHLPSSINWLQILILTAAVLAGGQLGSRLGVVKLNQLLVKRVTAVLVLLAGIEVLYRHLT